MGRSMDMDMERLNEVDRAVVHNVFLPSIFKAEESQSSRSSPSNWFDTSDMSEEDLIDELPESEEDLVDALPEPLSMPAFGTEVTYRAFGQSVRHTFPPVVPSALESSSTPTRDGELLLTKQLVVGAEISSKSATGGQLVPLGGPSCLDRLVESSNPPKVGGWLCDTSMALGAMGALCCSYDPRRNEFQYDQGCLHPVLLDYLIQMARSQDGNKDRIRLGEGHRSCDNKSSVFSGVAFAICEKMVVRGPEHAHRCAMSFPALGYYDSDRYGVRSVVGMPVHDSDHELKGVALFWLPYSIETNPAASGFVQSIALALRTLHFVGGSPRPTLTMQMEPSMQIAPRHDVSREANSTVRSVLESKPETAADTSSVSGGIRGVLVSPTGQLHYVPKKHGANIAFARKHDLRESELSKLLRGKVPSHMGWKNAASAKKGEFLKALAKRGYHIQGIQGTTPRALLHQQERIVC